MKNNIIGALVIGVIVAGGAFYSGMQYQNGKNANLAQGRFTGGNGGGQYGQFGQNGTSGRTGGRMMGAGGPSVGSVLSKDDKSITIKLRDGGSRIVFFSPTTEVQRSATGTIADIAIGSDIVVSGAQNTDGSMTAQSIQVRPTMPIAR